MSLPRSAMIEALRAAFEPHEWALAAWEAGSTAFGAADDWSDVDLSVVVEDDRIPAAFEVAEAALASLAPIELRHVVPEPAWHGHSQRFYKLRGAAPEHLVDLAVMRLSAQDKFLDPDRHGTASVLFDKAGIVAQGSRTPAAMPDPRERVPRLAAWFAMTQPMVQKEVRRGRACDALGFYHSLTLRPLIEILRIRYAPARWDFGMRYLRRDLPADVAARVEELAFVGSVADLEIKQRRAAEWFKEVAETLGERPAG